jgi:DNA processing protein
VSDHRAAYVALALVPGIGSSRLRSLLNACHTPLGAISAPFAFLCAIPEISTACATAIQSTSLEVGRQTIKAAEAVGGCLLLPEDAEYPASFLEIDEPPPFLFAKGDLALLDLPACAIVGSRDHSAYGARACRAIAEVAAAAGVVVVSGMARGLDAVAHGAALDAGGKSIGVLGNGLGVIYPAANRALYERMTSGGLLLTEFPPGEKPTAGSFPRRNRLISALARVTIVVEAAAGSGALITVEKALNQGRDVMAVPGPITSAVSVGTNRLIRDGAMPLLEPVDLLQYFPELLAKAQSVTSVAVDGSGSLPEFLTTPERELALLIGPEPLPLDDVASRSGREVSEVLALLSGLEIAGVVEQSPGRHFRRV